MNILTWLITSTPGTQIAKSFDNTTVKKIVKGAVWAGIDGAVLATILFIGDVEVADAALQSFLGATSIFLMNTYKEWKKGE